MIASWALLIGLILIRKHRWPLRRLRRNSSFKPLLGFFECTLVYWLPVCSACMGAIGRGKEVEA